MTKGCLGIPVLDKNTHVTQMTKDDASYYNKSLLFSTAHRMFRCELFYFLCV